MIVTTTDLVPGREIARTIGLVCGASVRGVTLPETIIATVVNAVGGEIPDYTKIVAEAREQALDRMTAEARARGADAVVGVRMTTCEVAQGAAEILAYGTAVQLV